MKAPMPTRPALTVDVDPCQPSRHGVRVHPLDPGFIASLNKYMEAGGPLKCILRVNVIQADACGGEDLPNMVGGYQVLEDGLRFLPAFPLEPGLSYQAHFDPRPLDHPDLSGALTYEFSIPQQSCMCHLEVTHIFPSGDLLPENLLRFYVCFSRPMQRGQAEAEITLLGPDGEPVPDVLYRSPVELWDRSMQCLTILLDPGRLKRGVGPNRELGPPLAAGQVYTLAVGAGMTDLSNSHLDKTVHKRFRVTAAVRAPIAVKNWELLEPSKGSGEPLVLAFPQALDWALLMNTVKVVSASGRLVQGAIQLDQCERRWTFRPASPWTADFYQIRIASSLEDVCGNGLTAPFDRPLRPGSRLAREAATCLIPFHVT